MAGTYTVDLRIWGKSRGLPAPYPLICHLLDAGAAAGALWDRYLSPAARRFLAAGLRTSESKARQLLIFWAALHDVGKAIPYFQGQSPKAFSAWADYPRSNGQRLSHGFAVHSWLGQALEACGYPAERLNDLAFQIAQMLGGHHGRFSGLGCEMSNPLAAVPELGDGRWEDQRRAMLHAVRDIVMPPPHARRLKGDAAGLACGLVILADWLVSQEGFLKEQLNRLPEGGSLESLRAHYQRSERIVPSLLAEAGLGRVRLRPGSFKEEFEFEPNELQRSVEQHLPKVLSQGPGLLLVMAPMGIGKTETALHGARLMGEAAGTNGVFVGLPTMATADQMYKRVGEYGRKRAEGPASLTLLHSMAWLSDAYQATELGDQVLTDENNEASMLATEWLRLAKRGLLAPLAVGTIDQALVTALCGRHNMLRMLGLTNKVFIVDEVHAYDAFMQGLLRRLLMWLGRLGVPVVLLSATLPRHVAQRLVESYLDGAGQVPEDYEISYPGWLYADATTGRVRPNPTEAEPRSLQVDLQPVPLGSDDMPRREQTLRELLAPALETQQGCVGVICNTVAEAQQTFGYLQKWFQELHAAGENPPELALLHSRFPAAQRERITRSVVGKFGKNGMKSKTRPREVASILVATQVIEQSIDLDFDLIISDLAPIALLLQRAGRGWRHVHNPRPSWAKGPRLVTLIPVKADGAFHVPSVWPYVYPSALLRRTSELLLRREGQPIAIPGDVQELVDEVYDEEFADGSLRADDVERLADQQAKEGLADMVVIPEPQDVSSLHHLTERDLDDALFSTRLGAESGRVLCCYVDPQGQQWLDPDRTRPLPQHGTDKNNRFTKEQIKELLGLTITVPGSWLAERTDDHSPPESWDKNAHLRKLVLLKHELTADGQIRPARLGSFLMELSADQGLVRHSGEVKKRR
ncbi:CRISPR-associated helicase Cas3' [Actinomadura kijaniata]|uniref:CRISPR-associated helicase Cas3' n=1 Tax=Actinomadura kijaniata TaxID=46161 RepID=UPI003F1DC987